MHKHQRSAFASVTANPSFKECLPWVLLVVVARFRTTRPEDEVPPQTPNSSETAGAGQQRPPASRLPAQHAPVKSTAVALPPQRPHASRRPSAQHWPERSSVADFPAAAAQQNPPSLTTPAHPIIKISHPLLALLALLTVFAQKISRVDMQEGKEFCLVQAAYARFETVIPSKCRRQRSAESCMCT